MSTAWVAPGRGASVSQLLSGAIQKSEPSAEAAALRLVRKYEQHQWCFDRTSLAFDLSRTVTEFDVHRMFEAIRRVVEGEDARDIAAATVVTREAAASVHARPEGKPCRVETHGREEDTRGTHLSPGVSPARTGESASGFSRDDVPEEADHASAERRFGMSRRVLSDVTSAAGEPGAGPETRDVPGAVGALNEGTAL